MIEDLDLVEPLDFPVYVPPAVQINRPEASKINRLENARQTEMYSGFGEVVPVVYGEQIVSGPRLVDPWPVGTTGYVWAIALSHGPIEGILQARANGGSWVSMPATNTSVNLGAGLTIRGRYDGTQTTPDSRLASVIPGYADVYPGVAYVSLEYSVQTGATSLPEVEFRVRGRRVLDPRAPSGVWTQIDLGFVAAAVRALASSGSGSNMTILAGGDSGMLISRQGAGNWELRSAAGFGSSAVLAVSSGTNNTWGAAGAGGLTARGANASANSWAPLTPLTGWGDMHATAYGRGMHIVAGAGGLAATRATTGTTWAGINPGMGNVTIRAALGTGSMLMLAGDEGRLATNTISSTWVQRNAGVGTASIRALATDGTNYLAATADGQVTITTDSGDTWSVPTLPFGAGVGITAAAYGEGLWIVSSDDGRIATSRDAVTWRVNPSPTGAVIRAMTYTGEQLIVAGDNGTMASGTNLTGEIWTENPALHLLDLASNADWGLGRAVRGAIAAADACDSTYSGVPRCRTGLAIQDPMSEREALDLLASYAEVLWGYDGDTITIIPDMPVDEPAGAITADQIVGGTLQLTGVGADQMPTQVAIVFTDRAESGDWTTRPALAVLPTDATEGVAATRSDVRMPGIYRRVEAERRAWQRLQRLQTPGRVAWQMMGLGIQYEPGDVVRMPDIRGLRNAEVRITAQPELIGPGQYQLQGELYNAAQYPDDGGGTAVPVGGLVIALNGIPSGYQAWSGSGFLVGDAVGGQSLPASGGNANIAMAQAGAHTSTAIPANQTNAIPGGGGSGQFAILGLGSGPLIQAGLHGHTGTITRDSMLATLPVEQYQWAKKVGAPATLQAGIGFLSAAPINRERVSAVLQGVGRYLAAGTRMSRARRTTVGGTTDDAPGHEHGTLVEIGAGTSQVFHYGKSPPHRHALSATIDARLRARHMTLYQATDEATLPPPAIIGWEEPTPPPAGWRFCDGTGGTIDMSGLFVELSTPDEAGTMAATASEMRLTEIVALRDGAHSHGANKSGVGSTGSISGGRKQHEYDGSTGHTHTGEDITVPNVLPARRTLRFIQYVGTPPEPSPDPASEQEEQSPTSPPSAGFFA